MIKVVHEKKHWLMTVALLSFPDVGLTSDREEEQLVENVKALAKRNSIGVSPQTQEHVKKATKQFLKTIKASQASRRKSTTALPARPQKNTDSIFSFEDIIKKFQNSFKLINVIDLPFDPDLEKILSSGQGNLPDFKSSRSTKCAIYFYDSDKEIYSKAIVSAQRIFNFRQSLCQASSRDERLIKEESLRLGRILTPSDLKEFGRNKSQEHGRSYYVIPISKEEMRGDN